MMGKRIVLNPTLAREIESLAPNYADGMRRGVKSQLSNALAKRFGVDAKTIRDIWNRKSWKRDLFTPQKQPAETSSSSSTEDEIIITLADSFFS